MAGAVMQESRAVWNETNGGNLKHRLAKNQKTKTMVAMFIIMWMAVSAAPRYMQFFAFLGSSWRRTKYTMTPPTMPSNMGSRYHQPLLVCTCIAWCCLGFYFTGWVKVFHAVVWFFMLVSVRAECKAEMMVGSARFERAISASRTQNPTKLDHDPVKFSKLSNLSLTVKAVRSCATRMPNAAAHAADPACDCCRVQESSRAAGVDKS